MRFYVIGITDSTQPFFTPEVLRVISQGRVFSGGKRHHDIVAPLLPEGAQWIDITAPVADVIASYEEPETVVFASGDPLFFGFANTLRRLLPEAEIVIYPTFNSLQMLAHRLVLPYHDMHIVSLTGRPWPLFDRALIERQEKIGVLTDRQHTPAAIASRMLYYGYDNYTMHVGEHLGHPHEERVTTVTLHEAAEREWQQPCCLLLTTTEHRHRRCGLPDGEFALLHGRERMITKMPIRLLSLQALQLYDRQVLWDVGFCTGSISIEARLLYPHLTVVAFEIRPECEQLIETNARHFGAPGIIVRMGDATEVPLDDLPRPDAVFIGGHGGRLKEIMARMLPLLNYGGCMVMNSVTDGSRQLFTEACQQLRLVMDEPLRVTINDYNTIEILKCRKQP